MVWALAAILVLGILIFVHELGHFLVAKWNNVGVIEFAIGFGRRVWKKKIGDTIYSLRLIPLGGFVKMVGDDPQQVFASSSDAPAKPSAEASLTTGDESSILAEIDPALLADRSRWFLEKGVLPKLAIVLAGPGFNLIFAVALAILTVFIYGKDDPLPMAQLGALVRGQPAEKAGFKSGDVVLKINGTPIQSWEEMSDSINRSNGGELTFKVLRKDSEESVRELELKVTPTTPTKEHELLTGGDKPRSYMIGVNPATKKVSVGLLEACEIGAFHTVRIAMLILRSLKMMVVGDISVDNIGGPILILKEAGSHAKAGLEALFDFMIFLSISLAILNLLPIPVLDGGHVLFFLIEAVKGRPLSLKMQEHANQVGLLILLALMVFAIGNDVSNIIFPTVKSWFGVSG